MSRISNSTLAYWENLYEQFCLDNGIVSDSDEDRADYAARGHLFSDPGSDAHDFLERP